MPRIAVFLCCLSLALARAAAQRPTTLTPVSGPSPFAGSSADSPAGQSGTSVPNSEVEPRVAVNPTDPLNIVGAWQQDRWSNGGSRGLVAGVSRDGGRTWSSVPLPGIAMATGGAYQRASDPWVSFAPNGDLYSISLSFNDKDNQNAVLVNKSTDGGLSWSAPIPLIQDNGPFDDKESITADPTDARYVYAVWDRLVSNLGPTYFARSTDGGQTWEPARAIYDPGAGGQTIGNVVLVLPNGALRDLCVTYPPTSGILLQCLGSQDKGQTWGTPVTVSNILASITHDPDTGHAVRAGDRLFDAAVDPKSGALYAVWADNRTTNGYNAIYFSMSADGGTTWSAPVAVNKTPAVPVGANRQAFTGTVQVAADGSIGVLYYDFRNNTSAPGALTDAWIVRCHPSPSAPATDPANWHETRLTDTSFDLEKAPDAGGYFLGDYTGLAAAGTDFLAFFSVTSATDPAGVVFRRVPAPGDANGDSAVTLADVNAILAHSGGLGAVANLTAADVWPSPSSTLWGYGDGSVDVRDAVRLLRYLDGLEPRWP